MRAMSCASALALAAAAFLANPVAPQSEDQIQQAINHGVEFLRSIQERDGTFVYEASDRAAEGGGQEKRMHRTIGATALAGLTMLECDVSHDDPAVQKAATMVRRNVVGLNFTYTIALSLMFLDKLGDPQDIPLIESLGLRLLEGQHADGGWSYDCPPISESELTRLKSNLQRSSELTARKGAPDSNPVRRRPADALSPEIKKQLEGLRRPQDEEGRLRAIQRDLLTRGPSDNSNSQFAITALWIARRYGLPVQMTLNKVARRYAGSGPGWGYVGRMRPTLSMTCAGLMGLAANYGANAEAAHAEGTAEQKKPDPGKNPDVRGGFLALGSLMKTNLAKAAAGRGFSPLNRIRAAPVDRLPFGPQEMDEPANIYYILWGVERVAVAYGYRTISKKDWYVWGADLLLALQKPNGSWQGAYAGGGADTCFALLFLRRANLAPDLSTALRGKIVDPAEISLQSGGVGGGALAGRQDPPAPEGEPRTDTPNPRPGGSSPSRAKPTPERPAATERTPTTPMDRFDAILQGLRDAKGAQNTDALLRYIHTLQGDAKEKARDTLAERLTRMSAKTLRSCLQEDDAEMRSAAALACGMKGETDLIPDLIPRLEDTAPRVQKAAHVALKALAPNGEDFGPEPDATRVERAKAVNEWKDWWAKQKRK